MTTTIVVEILLLIAMILSIFIPFRVFFVGERSKNRYKKTLGINTVLFFGMLVVGVVVMFSPTASASSTEVVAATDGIAAGLGYLGAALSTSISGIGGGIAVASAASAALGAIRSEERRGGKEC